MSLFDPKWRNMTSLKHNKGQKKDFSKFLEARTRLLSLEGKYPHSRLQGLRQPYRPKHINSWSVRVWCTGRSVLECPTLSAALWLCESVLGWSIHLRHFPNSNFKSLEHWLLNSSYFIVKYISIIFQKPQLYNTQKISYTNLQECWRICINHFFSSVSLFSSCLLWPRLFSFIITGFFCWWDASQNLAEVVWAWYSKLKEMESG